jgi:hypothetical protein
MEKKFFYVCGGIFLLVAAFQLGASRVAAQAQPSSAQQMQFYIRRTDNTGASGYLLNAATGQLWYVEADQMRLVGKRN